MSKTPFRSKFNWIATEGEVTRQVSYNIQTNETSESIPQENLLNPEACVVLEPDEKTEYCEQTLSVNPIYQVTRLAVLAECRRVESFVGKPPEYHQTHHGQLIFDEGSELYRFDIQFEVCGTAEFIIRYITTAKEPLCLYGMHLVLEKNSNPLGMFASDSTLNRARIETRIKDCTLSEKAARCKEFVLDSVAQNNLISQKMSRYMMNNNISTMAVDGSATSRDRRDSTGRPPAKDDDPGGTTSAQYSKYPPFMETVVRQYMDQKFSALEDKINAKLESLELRQNKKLDEILSLLKGSSTE
ncbi:uncharacterized protein LOC134223216 [Armigeres subalbatus]|uniref:uncharacterized protein LOC134223216 n=1 Tax=Armigeres subalbatus TaxID=124917 RepID=UPI002ED24111